MILTVYSYWFLNSIKQLIFVMVKCCVLLEVRTEFLNTTRRVSASEGGNVILGLLLKVPVRLKLRCLRT
jgi:hypothetical protein